MGTHRLLLVIPLLAVLFGHAEGTLADPQDLGDRTTPIEELDPTLTSRSFPDRTPAPEVLGGQPSDPLVSPAPGLPLDEAVSVHLLRTDPELQAGLRDLLLAKYRREAQVLEERRALIGWTNGISKLIFAVVHVVLAFGLWAAVKEFRHAGRTRALSEQTPEQTELKVSLEGIALKTSLHGFLILAAAIAFYFLYLQFVYPITLL